MKDIKNCYCGAPCSFKKEDEPCWGEIGSVDNIYNDETEFYDWIHACKGHEHCSFGGPYIKNKLSD